MRDALEMDLLKNDCWVVQEVLETELREQDGAMRPYRGRHRRFDPGALIDDLEQGLERRILPRFVLASALGANP